MPYSPRTSFMQSQDTTLLNDQSKRTNPFDINNNAQHQQPNSSGLWSSSSLRKAVSMRPIAVSSATVMRRLASETASQTIDLEAAFSTIPDEFLPQYKPELFNLCEYDTSAAADFWQSSAWLKALSAMAHTATKDEAMDHLLHAEENCLVERKTVEWLVVQEDEEASLSSSSTAESFISSPLKRLDALPTKGTRSMAVNAVLVNDRSKQLLREYSDSSQSPPPDSFLGGIAKSTRASVVVWMSKVVESMKWPASVFFTAVHAMDFTLPSEIGFVGGGARSGRAASRAEAVIPLLSVACVLVGVSSECEHKHLAKTRCFVGQVPNVCSVKDIICKELSVVARLNRGSLLHKTPVDFALYYVARLRAFDGRVSAIEGSFNSLYKVVCCSQILLTNTGRHINQIIGPQSGSMQSELLNCFLCNAEEECTANPSAERVLSAALEVSLALSVELFSNSLHRVVPASRIVALSMLHIFSLFCPGLRDGSVCRDFCRIVFRLDYVRDLLPLWPVVFDIYELCLKSQRQNGPTAPKFNTCSSTSLLVLEILAEGRSHHTLPNEF